MKQRPSIKTWDDFLFEASLLPDGNEPNFNITDPLEKHFFEVADKHGVIDDVLYNFDTDPLDEEE